MYEVKLEAFEGPLDLLLHLIKKLEINIYDISMAMLTDQYLAYLKSMKLLDINVQSEYLVMASELLRIKSQSILPKAHYTEDEEDPRDALVSQLLEYQNYKYYATLLKEKKEEKSNLFIKRADDLSHYENNDNELELNIVDLMAAYERAKIRPKISVPDGIQLTRETYSIQEASELITTHLDKKKQIIFTDLFTFKETKHILVTIFIAMLELVRHQDIIIEQQTLFGEIVIKRGAI